MNALLLAGEWYQASVLTQEICNLRVKVVIYYNYQLVTVVNFFIFLQEFWKVCLTITTYNPNANDLLCYIIAVLPNCGPIPVVENSTPIQNMARVTYTCLDGFTPFGVTTLTCLANGTWSPSPPTCRGSYYMLCHVLV